MIWPKGLQHWEHWISNWVDMSFPLPDQEGDELWGDIAARVWPSRWRSLRNSPYLWILNLSHINQGFDFKCSEHINCHEMIRLWANKYLKTALKMKCFLHPSLLHTHENCETIEISEPSESNETGEPNETIEYGGTSEHSDNLRYVINSGTDVGNPKVSNLLIHQTEYGFHVLLGQFFFATRSNRVYTMKEHRSRTRRRV